MPALDSRILAVFLARIAESDQVNGSLVQGLNDAMSSGSIPKPEDLVRLYAASREDVSA